MSDWLTAKKKVVAAHADAHAVAQGLTFVFIKSISAGRAKGRKFEILGSARNEKDAWLDAAVKLDETE